MTETTAATTETAPAAVPETNGKPATAKRTPARARGKKPSAKKGGKNTAGKKSSKAKVKTDRDMADVPVKTRRLALVKLLRKLGATNAMSAKPINELATKLQYNSYDVYCLAYHKFYLAAAGLLKTAKIEGHRGLCVYLTAKGVSASDEQIQG